MNCIELLSALATILTAIVAAWGYGSYRLRRWRKRKRLESYLRGEKIGNAKPAHTVMHLMAKLGMTSDEIFQASFDSEFIVRKIRSDPTTGLAQEIIFEYAANEVQD